ncbi:hypothetical protein [Croceivirga sp. JEA036]|uniref:hypothetical protein n=1 Tax=Croceivirga sp. JEA036 TaxID=2721162 RepID=UPI001439B04B|nr:hypothetical protein [Croceivirga sp. JEA036]NJB36529.1 hypothetical protein [Croceivirga sp. JEA036]
MKNKGNWFWNAVIISVVAACIFAFALHYQNYPKIEEGTFTVYSGIYRKRIPLKEVYAIERVNKIPKMERKSGFSWLAKEKGIFKDSLVMADAYVFVDDLHQDKLRIQYQDSLSLYFNVEDSVQTNAYYHKILSFLKEHPKEP